MRILALCYNNKMHKKLFLTLFLLLLLLPAGMASASYQTQEVEDIQAFAEESETLRDTPVSPEERAALEAELLSLQEAALSSIDNVFVTREIQIEARAAKKLQVIESHAQRQLAKGKKMVDRWYEKNKDQPGSEEKVAKMLERLEVRAAKMVQKRSKAVLKEKSVQLSVNKKRFEKALDRVQEAVERSEENIAARPETL